MLLNKSYQKAPASLILIQPIKKPREVTAATMTNLTVLLQYAEYKLKTLALTEDAGTFIA